MRLMKEYSNAEKSGDPESIKLVLKKMRQVDYHLTSHLCSADVQRKKKKKREPSSWRLLMVIVAALKEKIKRLNTSMLIRAYVRMKSPREKLE